MGRSPNPLLEEPRVDLRQTPRTRVLLSATVKNACGDHRVRIRDISRNGALIEIPTVPSVGSPVLLYRGQISVRSTVAWAGKERCGLQFQDAIDATQLITAIDGGRAPAHKGI